MNFRLVFFLVFLTHTSQGKRYAWQGVVLLPFIDEKRLEDALKDLESQHSRKERERNSPHTDVLFAGMRHPIGKIIHDLYSEDGEANGHHS